MPLCVRCYAIATCNSVAEQHAGRFPAAFVAYQRVDVSRAQGSQIKKADLVPVCTTSSLPRLPVQLTGKLRPWTLLIWCPCKCSTSCLQLSSAVYICSCGPLPQQTGVLQHQSPSPRFDMRLGGGAVGDSLGARVSMGCSGAAKSPDTMVPSLPCCCSAKSALSKHFRPLLCRSKARSQHETPSMIKDR